MTVVIKRSKGQPPRTSAEPVSAAARVRAKAAKGGGLYQARIPIYPKLVHGRWRQIKWALLVLMLAIYWITPWIRWHRPNGLPQQAVLVDFAGGRFYFFGIQLWPQEVYFITGLLVLAAMASQQFITDAESRRRSTTLTGKASFIATSSPRT